MLVEPRAAFHAVLYFDREGTSFVHLLVLAVSHEDAGARARTIALDWRTAQWIRPAGLELYETNVEIASQDWIECLDLRELAQLVSNGWVKPFVQSYVPPPPRYAR